jgi:hypothetical protein
MGPNWVPLSSAMRYSPESACCHWMVCPASMVTTAGRKHVDQDPMATTRGARVEASAGVGATLGVGTAVPCGCAVGHWPQGSDVGAAELARATHAATASAAAATRTTPPSRHKVSRATPYIPDLPALGSTRARIIAPWIRDFADVGRW